ncbi:nonstructural protein [Microviridae sp.]|nr:nonstructural protein [Microviridae sp.]
MIHLQFSIYDSKSRAYLPPFILPRTEQAVRIFSDCVNSESHEFGKHPEDYTLHRIGVFNDETGLTTPEVAPLLEASGVELRVA